MVDGRSDVITIITPLQGLWWRNPNENNLKGRFGSCWRSPVAEDLGGSFVKISSFDVVFCVCEFNENRVMSLAKSYCKVNIANRSASTYVHFTTRMYTWPRQGHPR